MVKRNSLIPGKHRTRLAMRLARRCIVTVHVVLLFASAANAISLSQYHQHIRQAVTALETLAQSDENESVTAFEARDGETVRSVRSLLPPNDNVEANGKTIMVDNAWLYPELDRYLADKTGGRYDLLRSVTERLKAIDDRISDLERPPEGKASSKEEAGRKLAEILSRPEYAHKLKQESAITSLIQRFLKWLSNLFPKPKQISPGSAGLISKIAQIVVIVMALVVLAFVLKMFLPRLFRGQRPKKKRKEKARIVLGERLEADQSARDLLADAEALARRGELRAAIRRAYIALLVELGDRKVISLAQHKTNRDYLRALREVEPLHRNVKQLTDSFERHWYGLSQANETDWQAFRSAYDQALR